MIESREYNSKVNSSQNVMKKQSNFDKIIQVHIIQNNNKDFNIQDMHQTIIIGIHKILLTDSKEISLLQDKEGNINISISANPFYLDKGLSKIYKKFKIIIPSFRNGSELFIEKYINIEMNSKIDQYLKNNKLILIIQSTQKKIHKIHKSDDENNIIYVGNANIKMENINQSSKRIIKEYPIFSNLNKIIGKISISLTLTDYYSNILAERISDISKSNDPNSYIEQIPNLGTKKGNNSLQDYIKFKILINNGKILQFPSNMDIFIKATFPNVNFLHLISGSEMKKAELVKDSFSFDFEISFLITKFINSIKYIKLEI